MSQVVTGDRCKSAVNWILCIFCQTTYEKAHLSSVMTKQMSDKIIKASHLDYKVGIRLAGVID